MPPAQIWERDATVGTIEHVLDEARQGLGRSLFIVGEAGLGKTTMLERASTIGRAHFQISAGRGDAAESTLPFGIIDQALRGLGFRGPAESKSRRRSPLQARAERMYAALAFLEDRAAPALMLLDDLHWADDDSLALLSFLCRRIGNLPVAVIGTLRPWPRNALDTVGSLTTDGDAIIDRLRPLSDAGAAEMLTARAGAITAPSARRAARLAAGNPLLVEEVAANIRRGRRLPESGGDAAATEAALRAGAIARAKQRLIAAVEVAGAQAPPDLLMDLGETLLASGDGRRAASTFRRVLAIPDLTEHVRTVSQRMLGRALFIRGAVQEARDAFRAAVAAALPIDKSEAARALLDEAFVSWPTGGPALATPLLVQARELAVNGSPALRQRADTAWAFSTFVSGDPAGIGVLDAAVGEALANPEADTTDFAWSWGTLGTYGNLAKWTERFTEATTAYEIGMQAAERMRLPVAIAAVAVMHGDTCLRTGKLREALELADRAWLLADLAPERAFWAAITHAYALNEIGQIEECAEWFRRARALADPDENWAGRVWLLHIEAVLAIHDRRTADACAIFDRLQVLASRLQILEPCIVPWAGDAITAYLHGLRMDDARAVLASLESMAERLPCRFPRIVVAGSEAAPKQLEGDLEAATRLIQEAIGLASASGMPLLEARLRHRLGAQLRKSGQDRAARPLLKQAIDLAEACGADRIAKKAVEDLKLAHGRRRRRYVDPDVLTGAELRVRRLAERGVKSKVIAEQLILSPNTIETHLQHIYQKLGINSQLELIALARHPEPEPVGSGAGPPLGR